MLLMGIISTSRAPQEIFDQNNMVGQRNISHEIFRIGPLLTWEEAGYG